MSDLSAHEKLPSICFVAQNAYSAISCKETGHIGGIERQQSMMAVWLANKGYDVKMITWDEFDPDQEYDQDQVTIAGVTVHRMCKQAAGIKLLRFFYPRWTSLNRAMARANADIYYYNLGDLGLGQMVHWARQHNRKTVYSVACDAHCEADLPLLTAYRERKLFSYGLKNVDKIIVQSGKQQNLLQNNFSLSSDVIPMPCDGVAEPGVTPRIKKPGDKPRILWVGRLSEEKRLEWLLDIAEKCPEYIFDVLGSANYQNEYARQLVARANQLPNVILHGRISHDRIGRFYREASLLCSTSIYEGFPNVFLEAWSVGVPVISTIDPDNVIKDNQLGHHAQSVEQFIEIIQNIFSSEENYTVLSAASISYFNSMHTIDSVMPKFESVFKTLAGNK